MYCFSEAENEVSMLHPTHALRVISDPEWELISCLLVKANFTVIWKTKKGTVACRCKTTPKPLVS